MSIKEELRTSINEANKDVLESAKNSVKSGGEAQKQDVNQQIDENIEKIKADGKAAKDEEYGEYDTAQTVNEVQRLLNQRYIERKAAEMGLSDSGFKKSRLASAEHQSRRNSNINQSVYKNTADSIDEGVRKRTDEQEQARTEAIDKIVQNIQSGLEEVQKKYDLWLDSATDKAYAEVVEAEKKVLEAEKNALEAEKKRIEEVSSAIGDLKGKLNGYFTESAKWTCIQSHIEKYGVSDALINMLGSAGYGQEQALQKMTSFFLNKKVSDKDKIRRFVGYFKIYGMPDEQYIKSITSGNMPGHNVTMDELITALEEVG